MAKRKIDENYMKTLLVEGMPYKPRQESSISEELRMSVLDEIEGVQPAIPETPSSEISIPTTQNKRITINPKEDTHDEDRIVSIEIYRNTFFINRNTKAKTSFLADREVLQILRYILLDTESATSLSDYVTNILTHHISQYRELINGATTKNLRKQTIPKL